MVYDTSEPSNLEIVGEPLDGLARLAHELGHAHEPHELAEPHQPEHLEPLLACGNQQAGRGDGYVSYILTSHCIMMGTTTRNILGPGGCLPCAT